MKLIKNLKSVALILAAVVLSLSFVGVQVAHAAGTATMYVSPASGSYAQGATLSIAVYEDSGTDLVNAVQANLSYNPSVLTYSNISSSAAFGVVAENTGGSGSVRIGRGTTTPVSGLQLVATVFFTAAAAGTSPITFTSGSAVVRSTDNQSETLTTTGGNYTVSAPASPPPAAPPPSPPPASSGSTKKTTSSGSTASPSPSPNPSPAPVAAPAVLTISSISTSKQAPNNVTVSWKTSLLATSEVDYGFGTKYFLSAADATLTKDHSLALSSINLIPNTSYHYIVKSVDAKGNQVASKDLTFKTTTPVKAVAQTPSGNGVGSLWLAYGAAGLLALTAVGAWLARAKQLRGRSFMPLGMSKNGPPPTNINSQAGSASPNVVKPTAKAQTEPGATISPKSPPGKPPA